MWCATLQNLDIAYIRGCCGKRRPEPGEGAGKGTEKKKFRSTALEWLEFTNISPISGFSGRKVEMLRQRSPCVRAKPHSKQTTPNENSHSSVCLLRLGPAVF